MKSKRFRDKTVQRSVTLYSEDIAFIEQEKVRTGSTSFSDALQGIIQRHKKVVSRKTQAA